MAESRKIREYRETLHEMAKPQTAARQKHLAGKAAKLGTEIHGEESKGRPKAKTTGKPRR